MIAYFGYGSNINLNSLRAKGVTPIASKRGRLKGWQLRFNVGHWFKHEGGMGNVEPSAHSSSLVEGMIHWISPEHLEALDAVESYGVGYDRIKVNVETDDGLVSAYTYVGLPDYIDNSCLPTRRYLNIIVQGAEKANLSKQYIDNLKSHPIAKLPDYEEFKAPKRNNEIFTAEMLKEYPSYTALAGHVFDMRKARKNLQAVIPLFGGKDMTLFHLKRHDTSLGTENISDFLTGQISDGQKKYINAYLNEYVKEFDYVGTYQFE